MRFVEWFRGGWNGHTKVITVITVMGLLVALGAWLSPRPDKGSSDETRDGSTSGASSSTASGTSPPPASSSSPEKSQIRYLSDLSPVTGASFVSDGGPPGRHALVIQCASGQSNDRSREVSWNFPGKYSTLHGRVAISGNMDPEHLVQLEWFADGARVYNNSTLTLGADSEFTGQLVGAQDLRVRLTCESSAGQATLLDTSVQR
jgi:hypothetical protein